MMIKSVGNWHNDDNIACVQQMCRAGTETVDFLKQCDAHIPNHHAVIYQKVYFHFESNLLHASENYSCACSFWAEYHHSKHFAVWNVIDEFKWKSIKIVFLLMPPQRGHHIYGLVQNYSNSIANAMGLLQSCTKPSISYAQFCRYL